MGEFNLEIESRGDWSVARLHGDASGASVGHLRQALDEMLQRRESAVVLDLADMHFINSLALGELVRFRREIQSYGGRLRLAGADAYITDVFRKTRLVELFPMYERADEAIDNA